ncbi:hypothetical protein HHL11_20830 [Ramlibacter sp. G-1-2-2]|uniref:Uncharacterized protein n=1 Tax=Ramlibacter agri TaxID=2728837 RepID=A0A848H5D8_9BURK|nr:hypothetical protein [Ramlibacter agri]NML46206.1 hypothetical protein [Ramlibacter agri]
MPNLASERQALSMADAHLLEARRRIARLEQMTEGSGHAGSEATAGALAALRDGLAAMEDHRRIILQMIADLESGRLKDRGPLGLR